MKSQLSLRIDLEELFYFGPPVPSANATIRGMKLTAAQDRIDLILAISKVVSYPKEIGCLRRIREICLANEATDVLGELADIEKTARTLISTAGFEDE